MEHCHAKMWARKLAVSLASSGLVMALVFFLGHQRSITPKVDLSLTTTMNTDWAVKQAFYTFHSSAEPDVQNVLTDNANKTAERQAHLCAFLGDMTQLVTEMKDERTMEMIRSMDEDHRQAAFNQFMSDQSKEGNFTKQNNSTQSEQISGAAALLEKFGCDVNSTMYIRLRREEDAHAHALEQVQQQQQQEMAYKRHGESGEGEQRREKQPSSQKQHLQERAQRSIIEWMNMTLSGATSQLVWPGPKHTRIFWQHGDADRALQTMSIKDIDTSDVSQVSKDSTKGNALSSGSQETNSKALRHFYEGQEHQGKAHESDTRRQVSDTRTEAGRQIQMFSHASIDQINASSHAASISHISEMNEKEVADDMMDVENDELKQLQDDVNKLGLKLVKRSATSGLVKR